MYHNRVKEYRKQLGMSVYALSRAVGVVPQTISNIENGKVLPNLTTMYAICKVLGKPLEEVFPPPQDGGATDDGRAPHGCPDPAKSNAEASADRTTTGPPPRR